MKRVHVAPIGIATIPAILIFILIVLCPAPLLLPEGQYLASVVSVRSVGDGDYSLKLHFDDPAAGRVGSYEWQMQRETYYDAEKGLTESCAPALGKYVLYKGDGTAGNLVWPASSSQPCYRYAKPTLGVGPAGWLFKISHPLQIATALLGRARHQILHAGPFTPFENAQNDAEGYRQHPWGQSVEEFTHSYIKERQRTDSSYDKPAFESDVLSISSTAPRASEDSPLVYLTDLMMKQLEGVPNTVDTSNLPSTLSYFSPDTRFLLGNDFALLDKKANVLYFFHQRKLAYISAGIDSDPTAVLDVKYWFVQETWFDSSEWPDGRFDIHLFKRGETNTRIYAVSFQQKETSILDRPPPIQFLIYVPSSTLRQLESEVNARVVPAEKQKRDQQRKATEALEQQTQQQVQ